MKGLKLYERSAVIDMPLNVWNFYHPKHRGVRFALYGYDKRKKNQFGISLFGSSHNPDSREDITMKDIDEELSRLKVAEDRIRTKIFGHKKVEHLTSPKERISMLHFQGMPYSQGFSGEYDYMSSRISKKSRYRIFIPKENFKEIKKKNKDIESFAETKDNNGNKYVLVEFGDIANLESAG